MPEAVHVGSGKVRELYALDDERLLLVASDRISAFDVVLPTEIPDKGRVLTGLSGFWFARTRDIVPEPPARAARRTGARRSAGGSRCCRSSASSAATSPARAGRTTRRPARSAGTALRRRAARVRPAAGADLHAGDEGARGARREHHARAGAPSSSGAERFAERRAHRDRALPLRGRARGRARDHHRRHEVRVRPRRRRARLVLGDEAFTPDSSRFWPADEYEPGERAAVLRQAVRPRLLPSRSAGTRPPPGPELPDDVVAGTRARYVEAFERITGIAVRRLRRRPGGGAAMKATVLVRPKPGILDPQGEAVESSLRHLGFAVEEARVGRVVDLEVEATDADRGARARSSGCASELLANPLIESYEIELAGRMSERRPRIAVLVFPGSNDDRDAALALEGARRRTGARLARRSASCPRSAPSSSRAASPTATTCAAARSHASRRRWRPSPTSPRDGGFVLGICNGFQILCEAGLLPGALRPNESLSFVCRDVDRARRARRHAVHLPVRGRPDAHDPRQARRGLLLRRRRALAELEANGQIVLRYDGTTRTARLHDIAGVVNARGQRHGPDAAPRARGRSAARLQRTARFVARRRSSDACARTGALLGRSS